MIVLRKGPIHPDGIYMLSTRNQPENIDEKKIYRYHIEFLEDYVNLKEMNKNLKTVVESLHEIDIYQSQLLKPHSQFGGKNQEKIKEKIREKSRRKK